MVNEIWYSVDAPGRVDSAVRIDEGFGERDGGEAEVPRETLVRAFGGVGERGRRRPGRPRAAASPELTQLCAPSI